MYLMEKGRIPQGVRGLKSYSPPQYLTNALSHPARGAWIEIEKWLKEGIGEMCRIPQGVRGLKSPMSRLGIRRLLRRIPQGVRGLK